MFILTSWLPNTDTLLYVFDMITITTTRRGGESEGMKTLPTPRRYCRDD